MTRIDLLWVALGAAIFGRIVWLLARRKPLPRTGWLWLLPLAIAYWNSRLARVGLWATAGHAVLLILLLWRFKADRAAREDQYRQGGWLFIRKGGAALGTASQCEAVLPVRDSTVHVHRVEGGRVDEREASYLEAGSRARVIHEEHEPLELPEGVYLMVRQREYQAKVAEPPSDDPCFHGRRYEIVAFAYDQRPLYYEEFEGLRLGGVWLLVARTQCGFAFYRGDIRYEPDGCNGPEDSFSLEIQAFEGWQIGGRVTRGRAVDVVSRHQYVAFAEIRDEAMRQLCQGRGLLELLSVLEQAGRRWDLEVPVDRVASEIMTALKLDAGSPIELDEVLDIENEDLRSRALAVFGKERLLREAGSEVIQRDGGHELVGVRDMLFLIMDSSLPRRRILRVPGHMRTLRQAVAWTFGLKNERRYHPIKET